MDKSKHWVIRRNVTGPYWSNDEGWVPDLDMATVFTSSERTYLNLPIEGYWQRMDDIAPERFDKEDV